jgi:hypothetical protein
MMINKIFIIQKLGLRIITLISIVPTKIFFNKVKTNTTPSCPLNGLQVFLPLLVTADHFFWNHDYGS